jgi:hypothetical protein
MGRENFSGLRILRWPVGAGHVLSHRARRKEVEIGDERKTQRFLSLPDPNQLRILKQGIEPTGVVRLETSR